MCGGTVGGLSGATNHELVLPIVDGEGVCMYV